MKLPIGVKEAAKRIIKAAKNQEKIIIFGDSDLDGVASVIVLKETFELLNPLYTNIDTYFPNRELEGHGLSLEVLEKYKDETPALLFIVDCGTANGKEITKAKKMGYEVIVIDHHRLNGRAPKPSIFVNTWQNGDEYPLKEFAAAGLVYMVAREVLNKTGHPGKEKLLEIVALATLSDMMPLKLDNEQLVNDGLNALINSKRHGIRALVELGDADLENDLDIYGKIIAPLNSAKIYDHTMESFELLIAEDYKKAKTLAGKLIKQNRAKKEYVFQAVKEITEKVGDEIMIFETNEYWPAATLGVIASKLVQKHKRPTFIFRLVDDIAVGSARLPKNINGVEALKSCKDLLEAYGGHAPACGCRLKVKNLPKLEKCLNKYFKNL
jgi:single-stranded-DNA-specific exonuclease